MLGCVLQRRIGKSERIEKKGLRNYQNTLSYKGVYKSGMGKRVCMNHFPC